MWFGRYLSVDGNCIHYSSLLHSPSSTHLLFQCVYCVATLEQNIIDVLKNIVRWRTHNRGDVGTWLNGERDSIIFSTAHGWSNTPSKDMKERDWVGGSGKSRWTIHISSYPARARPWVAEGNSWMAVIPITILIMLRGVHSQSGWFNPIQKKRLWDGEIRNVKRVVFAIYQHQRINVELLNNLFHLFN